MQQPRDLKKKKTPQKSHVWFTFSRLPPSVHFCGNTWTEVHAVVSDKIGQLNTYSGATGAIKTHLKRAQ